MRSRRPPTSTGERTSRRWRMTPGSLWTRWTVHRGYARSALHPAGKGKRAKSATGRTSSTSSDSSRIWISRADCTLRVRRGSRCVPGEEAARLSRNGRGAHPRPRPGEGAASAMIRCSTTRGWEGRSPSSRPTRRTRSATGASPFATSRGTSRGPTTTAETVVQGGGPGWPVPRVDGLFAGDAGRPVRPIRYIEVGYGCLTVLTRSSGGRGWGSGRRVGRSCACFGSGSAVVAPDPVIPPDLENSLVQLSLKGLLCP